ncbi:slipin family protein [Chitinophaga sp. Hz27]|uniref:slipin family protein n=1 Tax=Chitinophaga sp. Hz27 TaxID=3347169 RepID=UPI0035DB0134
MKFITIEKNKVGLLIKNGCFKQVLLPGKYWTWQSKEIQLFDVNLPFTPPVPVQELLADATFASLVQVVDVQQNEVALVFENGLLKMHLLPGKHIFLKNKNEMAFQLLNISATDPISDLSKDIVFSPLLYQLFLNHKIEPFEKAVLLVDGEYRAVLGGGIHSFFANRRHIELKRIDMRTQSLEISGQEILTKDKAAVRINAFAQYAVEDIIKVVLENKEAEKQLYVQVQLILREYVGTLGLDELLEKKGQLGQFMLEQVHAVASTLGMKVMSFGVRDIILPGDVKEIMNQVLVAEKKAQANLIMRREETASTRSLMNTAKLMEENPMLFKLKEMEYVERIAEKVGSITVNGGGLLGDQLRQIFTSK